MIFGLEWCVRFVDRLQKTENITAIKNQFHTKTQRPYEIQNYCLRNKAHSLERFRN